MAVNTGTFAPLLLPDIHKVYVETGLERPLEYVNVFNTPDMSWNGIVDRQISGLGTAPAMPEGSMFTLDQQILGGTKAYNATPYGLAYEVTRAMWEDEQYGMMKEGARLLSRASRNRLEVDAWSLLNNAFTAGFVGFDGLVLCSTSHTRLDGGAVIANRPSPDISFSVTGLQAALIRYENMVDERGLPRVIQPVMAVVGPTNKFNAREILGSSLKPFTANNEINSLVDEDLNWMVSHYLTTATNWFLLGAKGVHDLNFYIRSQPELDSFDDPWTKNAVFTVWQRHITGFGSYRGVDGSTG